MFLPVKPECGSGQNVLYMMLAIDIEDKKYFLGF